MRASKRARRYREADRAEASRAWVGAELGYALGLLLGGVLGFLVQDLLALEAGPWWLTGAGCVLGLLVAWLLHRAST